ncbi:hypothetical protein [Pseudolactococcus reticulitermitis]|uniref:Uncharacterized protein n=1 Tax=Pseudolactococcus reticulitermitis TaxID=2025039 RepID=A0A224WYX9_9LACT|nr:hypothetical protein [Lactococcus reticulitermitis]GAX47309.1 hypothetical protein RsY01_908 [Lactococcus reticulitermitis]
MEIKVLTDFVDFSVNRTRHVGEVFEVTEERFSELNAALPDFVEKFGEGVAEKDDVPKKNGKKSAAKK